MPAVAPQWSELCLLQYVLSRPHAKLHYEPLLEHNARYCRHHPSCTLWQQVDEDRSLPPYWKKVFMVDAALNGTFNPIAISSVTHIPAWWGANNGSRLPIRPHYVEHRCGAVAWIDGDAVITNHSFRLERDVFSRSDVSMYITTEPAKDQRRVNAGVFTVRNNAVGRQLIRVWASIYLYQARSHWQRQYGGEWVCMRPCPAHFQPCALGQETRFDCCNNGDAKCQWAASLYEQGSFESHVLPIFNSSVQLDSSQLWMQPTATCDSTNAYDAIKHYSGVRLKLKVMPQYMVYCLQMRGLSSWNKSVSSPGNASLPRMPESTITAKGAGKSLTRG